MDRRAFLKSAYCAAALAALPRLALARAPDGFFELTAGTGQARLYGEDGGLSDLWLYNGSFPGPEIRVKRGERVRVRFTNELDEPTSIHWHGIRIDNAMDGVAGLTQPAVQPGESFEYDFEVPDAGTYWYHAHNMSWNQVPRGLAGPLIIEDEQERFSPQTDITLMLTDWRLSNKGVLDTETIGSLHDFSHAGRLGNWLTVNGVSLPDIPLQAQRWHRLRLINSSASRILDLDPSRLGARIIALDGQSFDEARAAEGPVQLAPAQRMDLALRPENEGNMPFEATTGRAFTVANFKVGAPTVPDIPLTLPAKNALPEPDLSAAQHVPLVMAGGAMGGMRFLLSSGISQEELRDMMQDGKFWAFNGQAGMGDNPLFTAKRGETIVMESRNESNFPHAIHLHGHHFKILERDGELLPEQDWRDTFITTRQETVKIAFVADNPGKWLVHCHMLEHAASGMMEWFIVA